MRARLALASSGVAVELREILLRDKPPAFLAASPSGTVPCLVTGDGVIDESLDIMKWALAQRDPEGWLSMPPEGTAWISRADGPFKAALDRVKYASRHKDSDPCQQIEIASDFLRDLDRQIDGLVCRTDLSRSSGLAATLRDLGPIRGDHEQISGLDPGGAAGEISRRAVSRGRARTQPEAPLAGTSGFGRGATLVSYSRLSRRRYCTSCRCRCGPGCSCHIRRRPRLHSPASSPCSAYPC